MSVEFRSIQNPINEDVCPICQEEMNEGLVSHDTDKKVQHVFHKDCLTEWLKINASCPSCRVNVSTIIKESICVDLELAIREGNIERVRELLHNPSMTQQAVRSILEDALSHGFPDIGDLILRNAQLSELDRSFLLTRLRLTSSMIQILFKDGPVLDFAWLSAISNAIQNGDKPAAEALIEASSQPIGEDSKQELFDVAFMAAAAGRYDIAKALLENNNISEDELKSALIYQAQLYGDGQPIGQLTGLNSTQALLESRHFSTSFLAQTAARAVLHQNYKTAKKIAEKLPSMFWIASSAALIATLGMFI